MWSRLRCGRWLCLWSSGEVQVARAGEYSFLCGTDETIAAGFRNNGWMEILTT